MLPYLNGNDTIDTVSYVREGESDFHIANSTRVATKWIDNG